MPRLYRIETGTHFWICVRDNGQAPIDGWIVPGTADFDAVRELFTEEQKNEFLQVYPQAKVTSFDLPDQLFNFSPFGVVGPSRWYADVADGYPPRKKLSFEVVGILKSDYYGDNRRTRTPASA